MDKIVIDILETKMIRNILGSVCLKYIQDIRYALVSLCDDFPILLLVAC